MIPQRIPTCKWCRPLVTIFRRGGGDSGGGDSGDGDSGGGSVSPLHVQLRSLCFCFVLCVVSPLVSLRAHETLNLWLLGANPTP